MEWEVCPILQHMTSSGNWTPDLLILSPMPYPLAPVQHITSACKTLKQSNTKWWSPGDKSKPFYICYRVYFTDSIIWKVGLCYLCCFMTPGLSKDIRCHVWPYVSKLAIHQIADIRSHIKWAVSLVIAHMVPSIFLRGLCSYVWVNILTLSPLYLCACRGSHAHLLLELKSAHGIIPQEIKYLWVHRGF